MRHLLKIFFLVSITFLVGCGQKGPLYYPEKPESTAKDTNNSQ